MTRLKIGEIILLVLLIVTLIVTAACLLLALVGFRPPREIAQPSPQVASPQVAPRVRYVDVSRDTIQSTLMRAFREGQLQDYLDFYSRLTGNPEVASAILVQALAYDVPVNLCFALAYEESRFQPRAFNGHKNQDGSRDYGLFQLNSRTFRGRTEEELYDPNLNAHLGVWYLHSRRGEYDSWLERLMAYNSGYAEKLRYPALKHAARILERELLYNERLVEYLNRRDET